MKNLQRAGELLLARRCCSSVLAPVGCVGEVLGWHCGSEPVLDLPACDTGKSLKSTTFWCSNLSGLIPGLHVMAGQLPFGGKTPSASPAEGPIRDIPGGYSLRGLNNPACPSSVCCCMSLLRREGITCPALTELIKRKIFIFRI